MKLVKSLLLGSAAGLCAAAGAQAADLPVRKAAPVEYVRVCSAYGAGFFYIPGTETCLRIGGRARFEYQYTSNRVANNDVSGFRGLGRLNMDARTQTAYGTLRAFVRIEIASRTGAYLTSGTQQRYANAFPGLGVDTFGRAQKYVELDKAFVQFAGFTAGRASSFFDFYAHDLEMIGASPGSDVSATNLLAYTATFGSGFSATISMEDPIFRRNPVFTTNGVLGAPFGAAAAGGVPTSSSNIFLGQAFVSPVGVTFDPVTGLATSAVNLDVVQRNRMPDIVGALRVDQAWGSAQLSAAVHQISVGNYTTTGGVANTAFLVNGAALANLPLGVLPSIAAGNLRMKRPDDEYGFGIQGGLKVNLPMIAAGDLLYLQAAYAEGAGSYTGIFVPQGQEANTNVFTNRSAFQGDDAVVDQFGRQHLTKSWSATIAFLHYWAPQWRQGLFASWSVADFDASLRSGLGPAGVLPRAFNVGIVGPPAGAVGNTFDLAFDPRFRDYNNIYFGTNLIWSPVRDLDIGVEAVYERLEFKNGRAVDLNKNIRIDVPGVVGGVPKTIKYDDNVLVRMRVQRDF